MAETNVPPIPYKIPMIDRNGLVSQLWAGWFRQIFYRVGEHEASTNVELEASATAGAGLTGGSGVALAVNPDNSTIEISSNAVRLKDSGVTAAKMAGAARVGIIVQDVFTQSGTVSTGTTIVPFDDTIPQSTEGDQVLSQAITPQSATNRLIVEADVFVASNTANLHLIAGLFRDSGANALAVSSHWTPAIDGVAKLSLRYEVAAGSTTATTFKIRVGPSAAATVTFNGSNAARVFGGAYLSTLRVSERYAT